MQQNEHETEIVRADDPSVQRVRALLIRFDYSCNPTAMVTYEVSKTGDVVERDRSSIDTIGTAIHMHKLAGRANFEGFTHLITATCPQAIILDRVTKLLSYAASHPRQIIIIRRAKQPRLNDRWANVRVRLLAGVAVNDVHGPLRSFPTKIIQSMPCHATGAGWHEEILIRSAWAGASLLNVPDATLSDEGCGNALPSSHKAPMYRAALLWLRLAGRQLFPWPHRTLIEDENNSHERLSLRKPRQSLQLLLKEKSDPAPLATAAMLGMMLGTLPLIGCHCITIIFVATRLKLNRLMALNVSHLCAPPFVPAAAIMVGYFIRNGTWLTEFNWETLGRQAPQRFVDYFLGSLVLGPVFAVIVGGIVYTIAWTYQKKLTSIRKPLAQKKGDAS